MDNMVNFIYIMELAMYRCVHAFNSLWRFIRSCSAFVGVPLAAALFGMHCGMAAAVGSTAVVGEATLVIGSATLVGNDGTRRQVERGTHVRVGEQLETAQGGHVHLRFVDGARVSVRPGSRLQVDSYASPGEASSGIRFRLSEGVIRSITGQWGEIAKDKFRLNTPVAAIGVKGTDFVVKAEGDATAAVVFSGAIVLSPMTDKCVSSLGPCMNGAERVLNDTMKGVMLELKRQDAVPQLVPAVDLQVAVKSQPRPAVAVAESIPKVLGGQAAGAATDTARSESSDTRGAVPTSGTVLTSGAAPALASAASVSGAATASVAVMTAGSSSSPVAVMVDTRAAQAVSTASKVEAPPPQVSDLMWGRFVWAPALTGDDFSRAFEFALLQDRQRMGGNGAYTLLRTQAPGDVFAPVDPSAKFRLANSAATLIRTDGMPNEAARVMSATLDVNFAQSTYATELQVQASSAGGQAVSSSGTISVDGALRPVSGNALVVGGFNNSGKEAAYVFQKPLANGQLMGTTLWGR